MTDTLFFVKHYTFVSYLYYNIFTYIIVYLNFLFLLTQFNFNISLNFYKISSVQIAKILYLNVIILLLTLAGVPPFCFFFPKIMLFSVLFTFKSYWLLIVLIFFNFFTFYFYISHLKFIKKKKNFFFFKPTMLTYFLYFIYFNLFNFFYISWFYIHIYYNIIFIF